MYITLQSECLTWSKSFWPVPVMIFPWGVSWQLQWQWLCMSLDQYDVPQLCVGASDMHISVTCALKYWWLLLPHFYHCDTTWTDAFYSDISHCVFLRHKQLKYAIQHNTLMSYNTVLHVSICTNHHQALLITANYKTSVYFSKQLFC